MSQYHATSFLLVHGKPASRHHCEKVNYFGSSVAPSASRLLLGASGDQSRNGAAYIFVPSGP